MDTLFSQNYNLQKAKESDIIPYKNLPFFTLKIEKTRPIDLDSQFKVCKLKVINNNKVIFLDDRSILVQDSSDKLGDIIDKRAIIIDDVKYLNDDKEKNNINRKKVFIFDDRVLSELEANNSFKQCLHGLLESLTPKGLFRAAPGKDYVNHAWYRDTLYCALPLINHEIYIINSLGQPVDLYTYIHHAVLDSLRETEEVKIDNFIRKNGYVDDFERIHPKKDAETGKNVIGPEFGIDWGYAQNDMVGQFLDSIIRSLTLGKKEVLRDKKDIQMVTKILFYCCITYYRDMDYGIWEQDLELKASSVAACLAGIESIKSNISLLQVRADELGVDIDLSTEINLKETEKYIRRGKETLFHLFTHEPKSNENYDKCSMEIIPRESLGKYSDLTLLTLIFPYGMADVEFAEKIILRVQELEGPNGFRRHNNDYFYNAGDERNRRGNEAEWPMGFQWMAICCKMAADGYLKKGNLQKHEYFLKLFEHYSQKAKSKIGQKGQPELFIKYLGPNENTPLGWADAMFILCNDLLNEKAPKGLMPELKENFWTYLSEPIWDYAELCRYLNIYLRK